MMKRKERSMSRENRTHHERMWMTMKWRTQLGLEPNGEVWSTTIRWLKQNQTTHSSVHIDVFCVEISLGGHVVIGVGRATVQRHHADITNYWILTFVLLVQLCTCSQTVCCDRQVFPVAIYCTLLHRENGSFEVLCLHLPSVTVDRCQL